MSYITTGERIGYERGQQEQAQTLVLRQLQKRMGELITRRNYRRNKNSF